MEIIYFKFSFFKSTKHLVQLPRFNKMTWLSYSQEENIYSPRMTVWQTGNLPNSTWQFGQIYMGVPGCKNRSAMIWTGNLIQNQNTQLFFILSQTNNKWKYNICCLNCDFFSVLKNNHYWMKDTKTLCKYKYRKVIFLRWLILRFPFLNLNLLLPSFSFLINISIMSCVSPVVFLFLFLALSVPLVTTQSFSLRIRLEMSSSTTMSPSLRFLTAFSSPSLLSGRLCTHLSDWLCTID